MTPLLAALALLAMGVVEAEGKLDSWDPRMQYHVQTDEGPERYFKYQTASGQYRKERRLQDGTVVGTYGWVDADGMLRLRDYVADHNGYRILRSRLMRVGVGAPIDQALKAQQAPPKPTPITLSQYLREEKEKALAANAASYSPTPAPYTPTPSPYSPTPAPYSPTPSPYSPSPAAYTPAPPSYTRAPPSYTPAPPSYTPAPPSYTPAPPSYTPAPPSYSPSPTVPPSAVDVSPNSYSVTPTPHPHYVAPVTFRPKFDFNNPSRPLYDGVALTDNGFRYYLPRHYHEEQGSGGSNRAGSFGYVDPFGIRRVIYYNVSPGSGFQHRKNNKYVGLDAPPYDP